MSAKPAAKPSTANKSSASSKQTILDNKAGANKLADTVAAAQNAAGASETKDDAAGSKKQAMDEAVNRFQDISKKLGGAAQAQAFFATYGTDGFKPEAEEKPENIVLKEMTLDSEVQDREGKGLGLPTRPDGFGASYIKEDPWAVEEINAAKVATQLVEEEWAELLDTTVHAYRSRSVMETKSHSPVTLYHSGGTFTDPSAPPFFSPCVARKDNELKVFKLDGAFLKNLMSKDLCDKLASVGLLRNGTNDVPLQKLLEQSDVGRLSGSVASQLDCYRKFLATKDLLNNVTEDLKAMVAPLETPEWWMSDPLRTARIVTEKPITSQTKTVDLWTFLVEREVRTWVEKWTRETGFSTDPVVFKVKFVN